MLKLSPIPPFHDFTMGTGSDFNARRMGTQSVLLVCFPLVVRSCLTFALLLGELSRSILFVTSMFMLASTALAQSAGGSRSSQFSPPLTQARSSLAQGNPREAIQVLSSHLQRHPNDASARLLLAQALLVDGQSDQAEEQYQTILQSTPRNYLALAGLGELYERRGDAQKAEAMLARAARLSGSAPKVHTAWATALARLHRYQEASRALAGISPPSGLEERISFHRVKASVAAGLGDSGAAAAEMEKALGLSPADTGLQIATAAAEVQAKHWQRAASLADPIFFHSHDPGLGLVLLEAQLALNNDTRPILEALRTVAMPQPTEVLFRQRVAELLISHGRFSESLDELNRAVELEPNRADLNFNLALAQFKAGRLDDALATAARCRSLGGGAELEDLTGDIQEARGDNLAAVRSYQAAVAQAPNEEKYRLSLALELIRHQSFEPARLVLGQAEKFNPTSWRIQVALGMVEYFAGSAENATRILLKAADLAPEPEAVLRALGEVQMDQASAPNPAALARLCQYGDTHPKAGKPQFYCAALLFRTDYTSRDQSHVAEIVRRLRATVQSLPNEASPHCQLGKAYRWIEQWQEALRESETCARMDPNSADAHYRLAQIYQRLGQQHRSEQEMKLYEGAAQRQADENARRDETIKTFLYSIQNETRDQK